MKQLFKMFFTVVALLFLSIATSLATEVTFSYSDYKGQGTSSTGSSFTMSKTDVSITNTKFYCGSSASYAQFYANGTTTITPASGITITSAILTASSTSYNGYQSGGKITASTGTVNGSTSSTTVTWTGSATAAFTITNDKQIRWTSIVVTYTSAGSSAVETTTTISAAGITNTDVYVDTAAGSLSASITAGGNTVPGAVVTWSGNNDDVATINASTGAVTLVAAGNVTFTATYAGMANEYQGSSDTYAMTVTSSAPYVQPTNIVANLNNSLFGTNYSGSAAGIDDNNPINGIQDNLTITYAGSGNHYVNDSQIRFYPNNKLTFEAPNGYVIKSIVFTSAGTWSATISADSGTYTTGTKTWTGSATSVLFTGSGSSRCDMSKATITISKQSSVAAPTFTPVTGTTFGNDGLDVSISAASGTIYYTIDGTVPTTNSAVYSSPVHITETTTFKAIASDNGDDSDVSTATYTYLDPNRPGTVNNPYTVAQARAAIDAGAGLDNVYATGIISQIDNYNNTYKSITYWISSDGTTNSDQLEVYSGKGLGNTDFSSLSDVEVGATVVVYGTLKKYNTTYEFDKDNYITSYTAPVNPTIAVNPSSLSGFTYEEGSGPSDAKTFTVSGSNLTTNISLSMGGSDYEMSLSSGSGYTTSLTLTPEAGEVASTTIYVRLKADKSAGSYSGSTITLTSTGADEKTVSLSGTVTEYVAPYATLPFAFDGGSGDVAGTAGLTHNGLGSDYGSSPKLKFDGTGDYLILQLNERPGVLTYDIKGNNFSGGTFKIQTSVDGSSYTDLKSYTSLSEKESESFSNLASDVRYIKWIYTEKSNGNVALGNIALAVYTPPVPTITVTPSSVIADAEAVAPATEIEGTLAIAYENLTISDYSDFDIEFCDSEGNALAGGEEPTWIVVLTAEETGDYLVSYVIDENPSYESRNAYFKVYALDDESNIVRSSLITITQSGLPTPALGYAALPFEFTGGKSDIASTDGFTQSGLGSDYASAPSLKFDSTSDYVILHFNEAPGTLTFDIKGNGFSGGTFSVLTSVNGEDYSEFASYTDLGDTQSEKFTSLASNIRYIKWIYTEKSSGNVALGNINLTKAAAAETINLTATLSEGRYWVSFFSSSRYTLSEGAQAFTMNSSKQLYLLGTDGSVIPANTAVIIISDSADVTLTKSNASSAVTVNGGANILLGSDSPVAKYLISGTPYVLGIYGGELGLYEFTGDGIPANKAYYVE